MLTLPSFYLLEISVDPGGARKFMRYACRSAEEVHDALLQDLRDDPQLPLFYGQACELHVVEQGSKTSTQNLKPLIRYTVPEVGEVSLGECDRQGRPLACAAVDPDIFDELGPEGFSVQVDFSAMKLPPLSPPILLEHDGSECEGEVVLHGANDEEAQEQGHSVEDVFCAVALPDSVDPDDILTTAFAAAGIVEAAQDDESAEWTCVVAPLGGRSWFLMASTIWGGDIRWPVPFIRLLAAKLDIELDARVVVTDLADEPQLLDYRVPPTGPWEVRPLDPADFEIEDEVLCALTGSDAAWEDIEPRYWRVSDP